MIKTLPWHRPARQGRYNSAIFKMGRNTGDSEGVT